MPKHLVIVESPAKAKTIEQYLGDDYQVASCNGHIRDLPQRSRAVDVKNGFHPTYEVSDDKQHIVNKLRTMIHGVDRVYLASDDDREGESIAWHLKEALELDDEKTFRIVFREITKRAVLNALQHPRDIDTMLVNSQQARRILDRLVGYDLSPVLWKKIKAGLSAGRVQSVAVRMVVERERLIHAFRPVVSFAVTALLDPDGNDSCLRAELSTRFQSEKEANQFLEQCRGATFSIKNLEKKAATQSPSPPFTTSTLQQEASNKLGYSVAHTMRLAQRLYEAGKISYMRTDSVSLSQEAIEAARKKIQSAHGVDFFQARVYKNKTASAQEAHEAIRPTDFFQELVSQDPGEQRLYRLIWQRAIASQMADAQLEKTVATIAISTTPQTLLAKGKVVLFEGFLKVYTAAQEDADVAEQSSRLPPLTVGQRLVLAYMQARERHSKAPARYTEASLVRQLEERGIGRPSTYAPTIATIQKRGYVVKEDRTGEKRKYTVLILKKDAIQRIQQTEVVGTEKKKLFPTDTAMIVNDFLVTHFSDITDYDFTAKVEGELDIIAQGEKSWQQVLTGFYTQFYPKVEKTAAMDRKSVQATRLIGQVPETGQPVTARLGKYGPLVQLGESDGDPPPQFASIRPDQRIEKITLEEALKLFALPRVIGSFEGSPMVANTGRYGPYIKHKDQFYSLEKEEDPLKVGFERALEVIQHKRKLESEKIIKRFDEKPDLQILKGRWGPYIRAEGKNVSLPKDIQDPSKLTLTECLELVKNAVCSGKRTRTKNRKK